MKTHSLFFLALLVVVMNLFIPLASHAAILDPCPTNQAANAPNNGGCGIEQFVAVVKNVIRYLMFVLFPIAFLMIGWGGFMILTSAGNSERVSGGKSKIKIALTGVAIMLLSFLIIKSVFDYLQAKRTVQQGQTGIPTQAP